MWHVYRDGTRALADVTFSAERGEVVAVVGRNGSGKTTLLRHLNGLLKPTRGIVRVMGIDTRRASVGRLARHVGFVPQNPRSQLFARTALEEASFGPRNFGLPDPASWARRSLSALGLSGLEEASPLGMSGGQQKRLSIAASTSWSPDVVALDEPTVGQDLRTRALMLGLIRGWSRRGITVFVASHDVDFIWQLGPRVLVLSGGSIVADGRAHEVLSDAELLRSAGLRAPQLAEIADALGLSAVELRTPGSAVSAIAGSALR